MREKQAFHLGDRELDIMQVLWRHGKATVNDVHKELQERGNEIAYTTVQTMLNRLQSKYLVGRDESSRAHYYYPLLKEPTAVGGAIKRLAERFFKGSVEALAIRLIEEDLDEKQLRRLQETIDGHQARSQKR